MRGSGRARGRVARMPLVRLFLLQLALAVLPPMLLVKVLGTTFGFWVPALGVLLGAAAWVWFLSPDKPLHDHLKVRELSWTCGRWAALTALPFIVWWRWVFGTGSTKELLLVLLLDAATAFTWTVLTLAGLDLGRTRYADAPPARRP